jgi:hypothetical protein
VNWENTVEKIILVPNMLKEIEMVVQKEKQNLKSTQYKKKIYADFKRTHIKFNSGEHVYPILKIHKQFFQDWIKF